VSTQLLGERIAPFLFEPRPSVPRSRRSFVRRPSKALRPVHILRLGLEGILRPFPR